MSVWLLDVNVLVARFWEPHIFHRKVRAWMASHEHEGWATCPITQAGLVRTISNPAFSPNAPRPAVGRSPGRGSAWRDRVWLR